jgi:hypothetical protein
MFPCSHDIHKSQVVSKEQVCGTWGHYTCTRCGQRYCCSKCLSTHKETRCLKMAV